MKIKIYKVDADVIDKLIQKDEKEISKLDEKQRKIKKIIEESVPKENTQFN